MVDKFSYLLQSVMEEKAKKFSKFSQETPLAIPSTEEERKIEINLLKKTMTNLYKQIKEGREILREKEASFVSMGDYKYTLEKFDVPVIKITKKKTCSLKKEKEDLLRKLEGMSPERLEKLKQIKL